MSKTKRKPILCLDFDGVIHSYTSGWQGADVIPDPPVEGAVPFICQALGHFDVHIFSSRSNQDGGIAAMRRWLLDAMRNHFETELNHTPEQASVLAGKTLQSIDFPLEKPPAMVTIDDRAITFTGTWPSIDSLKSFVPWNKL